MQQQRVYIIRVENCYKERKMEQKMNGVNVEKQYEKQSNSYIEKVDEKEQH